MRTRTRSATRFAAPARAVLAVCSVLFSTLAWAPSDMRCGNRIIQVGDTKVEVKSKCGEPDHREVVSGADEAKREVWVYRMGTTTYARTLTFTGIRLTDIRIETFR